MNDLTQGCGLYPCAWIYARRSAHVHTNSDIISSLFTPYIRSHCLDLGCFVRVYQLKMAEANSSLEGVVVADDLLQKCHALLAEYNLWLSTSNRLLVLTTSRLQEFRVFIEEKKQDHVVDIRHFQSSVRSELKSLEKVRPIRRL
jgi:hypothetical protein